MPTGPTDPNAPPTVADLADLISPLIEADSLSDESTRADAALPGRTPSLRIYLSTDAEDRLAAEFCDLLDEYDTAAGARHDREDEIRQHYAMIPDVRSTGMTGPDPAQQSSEMTMTMADQAAARLLTTIMGVQPLMRVDAVQQLGFEGEEAFSFASSAEQFLQSYIMNGPPDGTHFLPTAINRLAKVGTAVVYVEWADTTRIQRYFDAGRIDPVEEVVSEGRLLHHLIDNRDVVIWPPTEINWQKATFVGHTARHTPESWRRLARRFDLPEDLQSAIEANPDDAATTPERERLKTAGIEAGQLYDNDRLRPVALTELWCRMSLAGLHPEEQEAAGSPLSSGLAALLRNAEEVSFQVILHRPTRRIVYIGFNPYFTEKKPYFPLRYKWTDNSSWGDGVGHECLMAQVADTSMWNLELDNLMAGAYWVVLRAAGSMYLGLQTDEIRPGMQIPVDDVNADFKSVKLGGEAPELQTSRMNNYTRARTATGLSSATSGQADPVMKSGASTGSVLALIEQGDKKLRMIDSNLRADLSDLWMFDLEVVAQYAPDGLYYHYADREDADRLREIKFIPPRGGEIGRRFRLRAQAPSAGSSDEARKQALMLIWTMAEQHVMIIDQQVTELLSQNNPAALPRWKMQVVAFLTEFLSQTLKLHEVPRLPELVPEVPPPTPQDQVINELQQQLMMAQQQLAQLAQSGVDMMGGAAGSAGSAGSMGSMDQASYGPNGSDTGGSDVPVS
jgi:hypothetical protein